MSMPEARLQEGVCFGLLTWPRRKQPQNRAQTPFCLKPVGRSKARQTYENWGLDGLCQSHGLLVRSRHAFL